MRIALIQCTSSKKSYPCPAQELYSESPRFRLSYSYAKLVADKIFFLSAKHGLVSENRVITPYNEALKNKGTSDRIKWASEVINELDTVCDIKQDQFIMLASAVYSEYLLPYFNHYWLPLKSKRQGEWIPELERLIKIEKETDKCKVLHILFNDLPRLDWTMIDDIKYENGVYIMFEKGEKFCGMDRIVRVGTHRSDNRLRRRLKDHFVKENADGSIFRKNIGRTFLNVISNPYLQTWNIDMHKSENKNKYRHLVNGEAKLEIESRISEYLRDKITFVCFPAKEKVERLRLEEGIIATLNKHPLFAPSNAWLGLNSPVSVIAKSGLWNKQGLESKLLTDEELERIKWLSRFGNTVNDTRKMEKASYLKKTNQEVIRKTADDVRLYIDQLFEEAKQRGEDYIVLVSGEIHKQMQMKNRMPQVCRIMYEKMIQEDEVLHTTPSCKSSTIKIRYNLIKRG